jgi:hypothetical protein
MFYKGILRWLFDCGLSASQSENTKACRAMGIGRKRPIRTLHEYSVVFLRYSLEKPNFTDMGVGHQTTPNAQYMSTCLLSAPR